MWASKFQRMLLSSYSWYRNKPLVEKLYRMEDWRAERKLIRNSGHHFILQSSCDLEKFYPSTRQCGIAYLYFCQNLKCQMPAVILKVSLMFHFLHFFTFGDWKRIKILTENN
jgi:hypothetical protein